MNKRDNVQLSELKCGQKGQVVAINNYYLKRRLLDLGITRGVIVKIKKIAPLGDPVDIELRGYELCLRLDELKHIYVVVLS